MNDFLKLCGTNEWIAAYTVYEKYKRSMELEHKDLVVLRKQSMVISAIRRSNDKDPNLDYLTQEIGKFLKKYKN